MTNTQQGDPESPKNAIGREGLQQYFNHQAKRDEVTEIDQTWPPPGHKVDVARLGGRTLQDFFDHQAQSQSDDDKDIVDPFIVAKTTVWQAKTHTWSQVILLVVMSVLATLTVGAALFFAPIDRVQLVLTPVFTLFGAVVGYFFPKRD